MKKVIIGGFSGSGKSTLTLLLDGHPRVLASYLQEVLHRVFTEGLPSLRAAAGRIAPREVPGFAHFHLRVGDERILVKFTDFIRLVYSHTYYPAIQGEALLGHTLSIATNTAMDGMPFHMDFARFEAAWTHRVFDGHPELTIEQVYDAFFLSMFEAFTDFSFDPAADNILAINISEDLDAVKMFDREFPGCKFLFVIRPIEDLFVSEVERGAQARNDPRRIERRHLRRQRIERQVRMLEHYRAMVERSPDRAMILTIDDVVVDYRNTMKRVAEFLGIEDHPILYRPTFHGHSHDFLDNYVGVVHDKGRAEAVLSPRALRIARYQMQHAAIPAALAARDWGAAGELLSYEVLNRLRRTLQRGSTFIGRLAAKCAP